MPAPTQVDTAAHSETHRDEKDREPMKASLHANVNPDTLPFVYAKNKHQLSFTVENTGEAMEIFKIKTTASYLYRIRPVFFKLGVRERQEVSVIYKGTDAGPIPLSAKDRITVVFAHALDPKRNVAALWELHKPYSHLSYAESREYVRVLFVDEAGRLAVSAAQEKSRGGLQKAAAEQRSIGGPRSITVRADPPREQSDEKSNSTEDPPQQQRPPAPRTPRSPSAVGRKAPANRTPSPNSSLQKAVAVDKKSVQKEKRSSSGAGRSRDPIQNLLSTVAKDASAIVCVQYKDTDGRTFEDDSSIVDEDTNQGGRKRDEESKKRDMDTDGRRDEVLKNKMKEMRRKEEEEKTRRRQEEEDKEKEKEKRRDEKRKEEEREERKKKEEEREERKKKEEEREEREERKRKEEERADRKKKEEEREERRKKEEEREERRKKEEEREERRKKEDEAAEDEKQQKAGRRTSNDDMKQEVKQDSPREDSPNKPVSARSARRRVLGPDGKYHDDDSNYLDEEIRRQHASARLLKKGRTYFGAGSRDNSQEDDQPRRRHSLEDDN